MTTTRPIRFYHRGRVHHVDQVAPTLSLLDWLREHARCTGTKEGCNEGDCGACTVLLAELAPAHPTSPDPRGCAGAASAVIDGLLLRPVNACLQLLPTLDGKAVLSIEDLADPAASGSAGTLHPVQQALVQCHASQCGFCTPGFAMTLAAIHEHHQAAGTRPTDAALADALSGNLCRCTGYRPILDAGRQMFELPARRLDLAPVRAALEALPHEPLPYTGPNAAAPTAAQRFHLPRRVSDLAWLLEMHPQARIVAGATDVGLWVNKQLRDLGEVIHIGHVAELKNIEYRDGRLRIGSGVSLEDAWAALTAEWPELDEVWRRFASPPIRHVGTLGGNVANGSPIGDGTPVLIALGAQLVLQRGDCQRTLPLEDFHTGYLQNQLQPGEFIHHIDVPLPMHRHTPSRAGAAIRPPRTPDGSHELLRVWKHSKRFDSDISAVCAAFALRLDAAGTVLGARLVYGGMAATAKRAPAAEQTLVGQPWGEAAARRAMAALDHDFQPLTDLRASSRHRRRIAANLLWKFWLDTASDATHPAATPVGTASPAASAAAATPAPLSVWAL